MEDRDRENALDRAFGPEEGGDKSRAESQAMIRQQTQGDKPYRYLIDSNEKSQLMDFLMRTVFASREELLIFNDYVAWCDDFGISFDNARRYVAARPAVEGLARKELVEALNTFRWFEAGKKGQSGDGKDKRKLPE